MATHRLLAKSYDRQKYGESPPDFALLTCHTYNVVEACDAIAETVGYTTLHNLALDREAFEELRLVLRANGWIQDLGKANSHFQEMVRHQPELTQLLRHEVISALLVCRDSRLRDWLAGLACPVVMAIWGAVGHHRKFDERSAPKQVPNAQVYVDHDDFREILEAMAKDLALDPPPRFDRALVVGRPSSGQCDLQVPGELDDLIDEFVGLETQFENDAARRFLAAVKAFGISADVVASAVVSREKGRMPCAAGSYVRENLLQTGLGTSDLTQLVNKWAWDHSECVDAERDESRLPPGFRIRDFQHDVAESQSTITLARAGCGSGKSLAAYLWAREWCRKAEQSGRANFRVFFCLPTTGTATEHFKDYALESGIDSSLTHSRSSIDLETIAGVAAQEEADDIDGSRNKGAEAARAVLAADRDKIDSLKLWGTPLVVATADTILGLMANSRRAIYSFPAIMCGAIVFDEVHAFDDQMFGHLLVFLRHFTNLPVLLMTASLPEARRVALLAARPDLCTVPGPDGFEDLERYTVSAACREEDAWDEVTACLKNNGKVLWVHNQVERANATYRRCRGYFQSVWSNVYHSRLRYKDRSHRHRQVVDRFKDSASAAILVATQVAEMSLDLSADLLVSDIAPISALIQRMGRLNRRSSPEKPLPPKRALILPLPNEEAFAERPYEKQEIDAADLWLNKLQALRRPLSQRDLTDGFAEFCDEGAYDIASAIERAWFFGEPRRSGLWRTRPGLTREAGYTVPVVLEADVANSVLDRFGKPVVDWLRKHEVSIPFKEAILGWESVATTRIAPRHAVEYDYDELTEEGTGARWKSP